MEAVVTISMDIREVIQVHCVDGSGAIVVRRRVTRGKVLPFLRSFRPALSAWRPAQRRTIGVAS